MKGMLCFVYCGDDKCTCGIGPGGTVSTPTNRDALAAALADLLAIVRIQNGNRHADVNEVLARGEQLHAALLAERPGPPADGWIVKNGTGNKFRTWRDGFPTWTEHIEEATHYLRKRDAEAAHQEDEDAWTIEPAPPTPQSIRPQEERA